MRSGDLQENTILTVVMSLMLKRNSRRFKKHMQYFRMLISVHTTIDSDMMVLQGIRLVDFQVVDSTSISRTSSEVISSQDFLVAAVDAHANVEVPIFSYVTALTWRQSLRGARNPSNSIFQSNVVPVMELVRKMVTLRSV